MIVTSRKAIIYHLLCYQVVTFNMYNLYFQAHKLMSQLEEFSDQEGINFNSLKTVFKTLLSVTNSELFFSFCDCDAVRT